MSDRLAKFEEAWNAWEHQVVYQKLATSKQDDDVKISVVLREALDQTQRPLAGVHLENEKELGCK